MTLLLLLLLQAAEPLPPPAHCVFANPPRWPSLCFEQMDDEAVRQLTMTRNGVPLFDIPDGAVVLGWYGTQLPGTVIHQWVWTREDKSVSTRLLHGDALERVYADVVAWVQDHPRPPQIDKSVPRTVVSN